MLQIMRANVTGGSGGKADVPGLRVGGKTGTGEKFDLGDPRLQPRPAGVVLRRGLPDRRAGDRPTVTSF